MYFSLETRPNSDVIIQMLRPGKWILCVVYPTNCVTMDFVIGDVSVPHLYSSDNYIFALQGSTIKTYDFYVILDDFDIVMAYG